MSDDQRSFPAWVFQRDGGKAIVYRYPKGPRMTFDDPLEACAEFIIRYVTKDNTP